MPPRRPERNIRARTFVAEGATDPSTAEPPLAPRSRQCEKVLALDRAVRCLERAHEELAACIWAASEAAINFWIDQLRTARAVFHDRLVEYREHHDACAACQPKIESYPTVDVDIPLGES